MIEMDFNPKDEAKPHSVEEDAPIPTYEEWLDEGAKEVFNHPGFALAKGAIELIKYYAVRERLFINLLLHKDVISQDEVNEFFGDDAHKSLEKEGVKQLTRHCVRAASQGKIQGPGGTNVDPDTVLTVLNDVLDLNNTGWDGRTLEIVSDLMGDKDLPADYEEEMGLLKTLNAQRAEKREKKEKQSRFEAELERHKKVDRARRTRIYASQCRISDKPLPSEEDVKRMLEGEIEIPKSA